MSSVPLQTLILHVQQLKSANKDKEEQQEVWSETPSLA